jgi:hypothetical protein
MSYTSMCALNDRGELLQETSFKNAWRGAMHVWGSVQKRFFPDGSVLNNETLRQVWDTYKDQAQPDWLRITVGATFDHVLFRPLELPYVAAAFRRFAEEFGPGSLLEQAASLDVLASMPGLYAVGWCQTSVIDNPWLPPGEAGEPRPFRFAEDPHWFLFDDLPELIGTQAAPSP